jgi:hypothetical protein
MAEETQNPNAEAADTPEPQEKAKADRPKREKAPAAPEKPFQEFITQDFLPSLQKTLGTMGIQNADITLKKQPLPVKGMEEAGECWQIIGRLEGSRQFLIGFLKEDIEGQKVFSYSDSGGKFSTLESFMIDERKVNLDLLLLYTIQRLNGQKWLVRN